MECPGGRCVLTSSQQAWNHAIPKDGMQHAYWLLEKRKTVRVSTPNLFRGSARKDSAVRVSLSSYHNVKEPAEERPKPHSRTPNGSKTTLGSQRQPRCLPRRTRSFLASVRWIAQSRIVPQEVGATRAKCLFRDWGHPCQGAKTGFCGGFFFRWVRGRGATFLPEYAVTLPSLTAW